MHGGASTGLAQLNAFGRLAQTRTLRGGYGAEARASPRMVRDFQKEHRRVLEVIG
jgi:hypothetical protein